MSIYTLHYAQTYTQLYYIRTARNIAYMFRLRTHSTAMCARGAPGAAQGAVRVAHPPAPVGYFLSVCCFCGVSRLCACLRWLRVHGDVGVGCAGDRWCRTLRACMSWHRAAHTHSHMCVLIYLFTLNYTHTHTRERLLPRCSSIAQLW